MKRLFGGANLFIVGAFFGSLFSGFLNPVYITLVLARLDERVIAAGSLLSAAFPLAIGLLLEKQRIFDGLYRLLPLVMALEVLIALLSAAVAAVDLAAYYLLAMIACGVLSSSVLFLLHRTKERRVRRARAVFDRRCAVAEAVGYLTGSAVSMVGLVPIKEPTTVVLLGAGQTLIVYLLLLRAHRPQPTRKRHEARSGGEAEDPLPAHPPCSPHRPLLRASLLAA